MNIIYLLSTVCSFSIQSSITIHAVAAVGTVFEGIHSVSTGANDTLQVFLWLLVKLNHDFFHSKIDSSFSV